MRIALVYPATKFDHRFSVEALPIGILYLAAVVERQHGAVVDVFDSRHGPALPDAARVNDYDVIGFSAMSPQIRRALQLAGRIRRMGYQGQIAFGGPHASVAHDHLKTQDCADAVFVGEAEESFVQYLNSLEGKQHRLERVWIRDRRGEWAFHPGDRFVKDLDALPLPAREKYGDVPARTRFINMTTTRGCPFKCNYCQPTKRVLFGNRIRRRSVENIVEEIRDAVRRFGITYFSVDDDTFTFHESTVGDFCREVAPFGLHWSCQSRSDIGRATLEAMRDAGCDALFVGVESGSQRVLELMDKKNTVERNAEFIRTCNSLGIRTWCNMMVGYPGETARDMELSLEFVRATRPSRVCVSQVTPFPGTHLWQRHRDDILHQDWNKTARHAFWPKFKSMAHLQPLLHYYQFAMGKEWDEPLGADVLDHSGWLPRWVFRSRLILPLVMRYMPFLLPFLTRKGRSYLVALDQALDLVRSGEVEQGTRLLEQLKRRFPRKTEPLGHLGWIYLTTERPARAVENYTRLLAFDPDNAEAKSLLAKARLAARPP